MNKHQKLTTKNFNAFPRFTEKQIASLKIALALAGGVYVYFKFMLQFVDEYQPLEMDPLHKIRFYTPEPKFANIDAGSIDAAAVH